MVGPDGSLLDAARVEAGDIAEQDQLVGFQRPLRAALSIAVVDGAEAILAESDAATVVEGTAIGEPAAVRPERSFAAWSRRYMWRVAALDALLAIVAVVLPSSFSSTVSSDPQLLIITGLTAALAWPLAVGLARGYLGKHVGVGSEELRGVIRAGIGVITVGAFVAGLSNRHTFLTLIVIAVPLVVCLSLLARFVLRKHLHFVQRRGANLRRVIVAGGANSICELTDRLESESHLGMTVVGACLPRNEMHRAVDLRVPVLGDLEYVSIAAHEFGCDAIAVTSDDATRSNYLRKIAWALEGVGVELLVDPGLVEVAGPRMHIRPILGLPLVQVEQPRFSGWRRAVKRATDIGLTSVGLLLISPILITIAAAIKITDRGPVLFRQVRVGRDGQPFTMLKFRSMVVDAEARKADLMAHNEGHGALFKLAHDPRVTRIGQILRDFSLDELPQLFNVLRGSMSLVGPRPHLASELAQMPQEASRRSLVTPGLTGLWQVSGRSDLSAAESIRLDLRYVENWSFTLDLLILWKTAFAVLAKRGAR